MQATELVSPSPKSRENLRHSGNYWGDHEFVGRTSPWNITLYPTQPSNLLPCFLSTSFSPGLEQANHTYDQRASK